MALYADFFKSLRSEADQRDKLLDQEFKSITGEVSRLLHTKLELPENAIVDRILMHIEKDADIRMMFALYIEACEKQFARNAEREIGARMFNLSTGGHSGNN